MSLPIPRVAVEVVEGLPGSGKSFWALGEVLRVILEERRPVFTNLPIRMRVVREYLRCRGGDAAANLIFPLTQPHFERFLSRQAKRAEFRKQMEDECRLVGKSFREAEFLRRWEDLSGPDIHYAEPLVRRVVRPDGSEFFSREPSPIPANWISHFAYVVIDEAHEWYPGQAVTGDKVDVRLLVKYLAMHRHHGHDLVFITQDRMNIANAIRRMSQYFTRVRDRSEDRIAWGVRFKHLGLRAFAYVRMTPQQEQAFGEAGAPSSDSTVFPGLRSQRWKFRLYDSYVHVGGVRNLTRRLREVRKAAGLDDRQKGDPIVSSDGKGGFRVERFGMPRRSALEKVGVGVKWISRAALYLALVGLGGGLAECAHGKPHAEAAPAKSSAAGAAEGPAPVVAVGGAEWAKGHKLGSFGRSGVSVDGKRIALKEGLGDGKDRAELVAVDVRRRLSVWASDGVVWRWSAGGEPERVGTVQALLGRIGGSGASGSGAGRGGVGIPASGASGSVGAAKGDGVLSGGPVPSGGHDDRR